MGMLSGAQLAGVVVTLALIVGIGVWSGRRVKDASDFSTGGKSAGATLVFGMITGTLVGGSSTIGTAQLAYTYGFSAWWFTIGAGLACLVMAIFYIKPLRSSGSETIQGMIAARYGETARVVTSVLASLGILLNIVAQLLAANALLVSMFGLSEITSSVLAAGLMIVYVVFGGVLGAGILGIVKLVLIYVSVVICGVSALRMAGGLSALAAVLPKAQYFNFFARGVSKDLGTGLSLVVGVLSTQTYIQAVIAGRSDRDARIGTLLSAAACPPVGLFGIFVGMFMRVS